MLSRFCVPAAALFLLAAAAPGQTSDGQVDLFETRIRPVLAARCYGCHSASTSAPQGGLALDSVAGIRKGGNSGPLLVAGKPNESLLVRALRHKDPRLKMPPGNKPLPADTLSDFEAWIQAGAPMPADRPKQETAAAATPRLWSLSKPEKPVVPSVRDAAAVRTEVDRFVLARLEQKDLKLAPEADRRTLIRRASFDLTGLPPTADEVNDFVKDSRPDAYERLVDRLLASPHYGERWGRHWLDVARYADSVNDSVNAGQRYAWSYTYRDWVINSLNEDLPYDQFLLYQLAADRVTQPQGKADRRHLAALGFLSLGREFPGSFAETVDDRIDAVTRGMLGLTVACARCHDHKYDPIPTKDYYGLYSVLSNIREPRDLPELSLKSSAADAGKEARYRQRLLRIREADRKYRERRNAEMVAFFKTQVAEYLIASHEAAKLTNPEIEELVRDRQLNLFMLRRWRKFLDDAKTANDPVFRAWHAMAASGNPDAAGTHPAIVEALASARPGTLKDLAAVYSAVLAKHDQAEAFSDPAAEQIRRVMRGPQSPADVPVEHFESIATEGDGNNLRSIRVRYGAMLAQAAYDGAAPRAMAVEDVPEPKPGHVFLRGNPNNPGAPAPPHFLTCLGGSEDRVFKDGSGRLELARAIIDPQNPLTARVMVNRVWMHHFGSGLVRTPSDFGTRGELPTHPELLDYLAVTFAQDYRWSLKKLHRAIMTSAVYRQVSADNPQASRIDPENQLLWRMNRKRLEIEAVRDAALQAAGTLDLRVGGLPIPLTAQPSVPRRSVYGFIERGRLPGFLNAFDFASPDQHAPVRFVTTVPQQALFYLNSSFVNEQARSIAGRAKSIQDLYRLVYGRDPEPWEAEAGERYLKRGREEKTPSSPSAETAWRYGTSDGTTGDLIPFSLYTGDRWQGGPNLPAERHGKALLRASGGEPGESEAVVRRWVSPVSGKVSIEGTLRHGQPAVPYGDGVRGRIVSSRHGELASFSVNGSSAETRLGGISVETGDTLDFIVDARKDPENDGFNWAPVIRLGDKSWNAAEDFAGPAAHPLTAWERYAQVLLLTNEFVFVD